MMALTPKRLFLSLSAFLSLLSASTLFLALTIGHYNKLFSLKMRVSSKELFSTLKVTSTAGLFPELSRS